MKLVRPLGIERVNDESEPYPSKGLRIPVDEMHAECTQANHTEANERRHCTNRRACNQCCIHAVGMGWRTCIGSSCWLSSVHCTTLV